jgi:hypothetical protein
MYIECSNCQSVGTAALPEFGGAGFLACPNCGEIVSAVGVSEWLDWLKSIVAAKSSLRTRKQSSGATDAEISMQGLAAELAAVLMIAPSSLEAWKVATARGGGNRGRDLTTSMTGLPKPVEVKVTKYRSATAGCLLIRPPRMTPGPMRPEYIDDSIYLLLHDRGKNVFELLGWIDRAGLLTRAVRNPVPVRVGQRETIGCHWSQLYPLRQVVASRN